MFGTIAAFTPEMLEQLRAEIREPREDKVHLMDATQEHFGGKMLQNMDLQEDALAKVKGEARDVSTEEAELEEDETTKLQRILVDNIRIIPHLNLGPDSPPARAPPARRSRSLSGRRVRSPLPRRGHLSRQLDIIWASRRERSCSGCSLAFENTTSLQ